jgi:Ca-activated chloride channel family protein
MIPQELLNELLENTKNCRDSQLSELIDKLLERLTQEGYVTSEQPRPNQGPVNSPTTDNAMGAEGQAKFELTDKALDFLDHQTLKDLLGALGKSSFGRHDTRELSTGIEADGSSRRSEFGDTMNLEVNATLLSAIEREGLRVPLQLDCRDLQVRQCEHQSSCATVLMLDCSHSMVLYGEDRFTPAKKVPLALKHMIRTQYPSHTLHLVLFHDSAGAKPISLHPTRSAGICSWTTCRKR